MIINQRPLKPQQELVNTALIEALRNKGLQLLNWKKQAQIFRRRLHLLQTSLPQQNWPELADKTLLLSLEEWLLPYLGTARSHNDLHKIDLLAVLSSRLDWRQLQQLERLAPERIRVPSWSHIRLLYSLEGYRYWR